MYNQIRKIIKDNTIELKSILYPYLFYKDVGFTVTTEKPKIYVFLCGFYQNLGDMALTLGHKIFLEKHFGAEYEVILIPSTSTYSAVKCIRKKIKPNDIVTILGGGNMDDIYVSLENCRRFVIKSFKRNQIVLFPQTMAFRDDFYGNYRLSKTVRTYNKHPDLYIFTREEKSLAYMKKYFTNAKMVEIVPDIVLSIRPQVEQKERKGIHVAFRHDKEKNDLDIDNRVYEILNRIPDDISIKDTVDVSIEECSIENYDRTLNDYWNLLAGKKVVITDRLHCMIFCVITGTPCVVFDNSNCKVSGVYNKWLSNLKYIKMERSFSEVQFTKDLEEMYNLPLDFPRFDIGNKFDKLIEALKS